MKSGVVTLRSFSGSKTVDMFFNLALLCSVLSCVLAAPAGTEVVPLEKQQPTVIPIVSQSEELETNGTYKFSYETGNGIKREEISYEKVIPLARSGGSEEGDSSNESNEIHVQQGSYSYVAPDGTLISVKYIADENGFRPVGDHLPRAPVLVPESESKPNEKSGRALKPKVKEDKPEPEVKPVEVPQEAKAQNEEKEKVAPATEAKEAVEKAPEEPKTDVPQKGEESPAAGSVKAESENAPTTEAAAATESATTAAAKDSPASTTVAASESASTNAEAALTTEAATTAADKITAAPTTEAVAASEAVSTTAASEAVSTTVASEAASTTAAAAEASPAQASTEASSSNTEQANPTTSL